MQNYPLISVLIWIGIGVVGILATAVLIAAGVAGAVHLWGEHRKRWRRIHYSPKSRFYQPKGRL